MFNHLPAPGLNRRDFAARLLATLGAASTLGVTARLLAAEPPAGDPPPAASGHDMSMVPPSWREADQVAILVYPQCTALDVIGPQYMFGSLVGASVRLVAKTLDPITTDTKVRLLPDCTFDDCPRELTVLNMPGGTQGTLDAMQDRETVAFLADRGSRARFVTSVCTGSLLLGAAGLLDGYKATSHWATLPVLARFGAIPTDERVVLDRNRITGAGVTAGLDLGLTMLGILRDRPYAECVQLLCEYDPQPPFDGGSLAKSTPANRAMMVGFTKRADAIAQASVSARSH